MIQRSKNINMVFDIYNVDVTYNDLLAHCLV
jgi:hypothetical protein